MLLSLLLLLVLMMMMVVVVVVVVVVAVVVVVVTADDAPCAVVSSQHDYICTVCEMDGSLIPCDGVCLRSFHLACIKDVPGAGTPGWQCEECVTNCVRVQPCYVNAVCHRLLVATVAVCEGGGFY